MTNNPNAEPMHEHPIHAAAALFPAMEPREFDAFMEDIKANGLHDPIWLHEGQIIDGRHRYWACRQLGIAPRFQTWDGAGSLVEFVVSQNVHRRHMNPGQKAVLAVELLPMLEKEAEARRLANLKQNVATSTETEGLILAPRAAPGKSAVRAARLVQGTSPQYVKDAKRMKTTAPEVFGAMRQGTVTMQEARKLEQAPPEQRTAALTAITGGQAPKEAIEQHAAPSVDEQWKQKDPIAQCMTRLAKLPMYEPAACINNMEGLMAMRYSMQLHRDIARDAVAWLTEYARLIDERLAPHEAEGNIRRMKG